MKTVDFELPVGDKYLYRRYKEGGQEAFRYGEGWRDLTGDNLILQMGFLLEEARNLFSSLHSTNLPPELRVKVALFLAKTERVVK